MDVQVTFKVIAGNLKIILYKLRYKNTKEVIIIPNGTQDGKAGFIQKKGSEQKTYRQV